MAFLNCAFLPLITEIFTISVKKLALFFVLYHNSTKITILLQ